MKRPPEPFTECLAFVREGGGREKAPSDHDRVREGASGHLAWQCAKLRRPDRRVPPPEAWVHNDTLTEQS